MAKKPTPTLSWHGPRAASCSYAPGKRSCRAPFGEKGRQRAGAKCGQLLWPTMAQMATTNNDRQANSRSAGPDGTSGPAKRAGPSRQTAWPAARALPHRPGAAAAKQTRRNRPPAGGGMPAAPCALLPTVQGRAQRACAPSAPSAGPAAGLGSSSERYFRLSASMRSASTSCLSWASACCMAPP